MSPLIKKYGLKRNEPSVSQERKWLKLVEKLIARGVGSEEAGRASATENFKTYRLTAKMKTNAKHEDTVNDLVKVLNDKQKK
ncbi:hypothetical protein A9Q84_13740 [Halobacteriovorax marinus]|mgnify:CR=1 FL=1|uniref:Uncharacterized protein n=1 Tax=Halobacteriovorax marinus TaxID=97084 RepID=A0A1Y5FFJ1_9BACT|nr:hypothetical protein A9Q84_13740 [Halobacteriovorax marinus]